MSLSDGPTERGAANNCPAVLAVKIRRWGWRFHLICRPYGVVVVQSWHDAKFAKFVARKMVMT